MRSNEHDTRSCVFAGFLDEAGQLWLNGRSRDTIRTGSETVHASEVERCLQLHPEVLAAAVVGLPHDRLGQQARTHAMSHNDDQVLLPASAFVGPGCVN